MKKFLTILILFATLFTFGQQVQTFKRKISLTDFLVNYNDKDINLAQGVDFSKIVDTKKINDFSKPFTPYTDFQMKAFKVNEENGVYAGFNTEKFYNIDFAADPFNGKIQIYVMGEPLPSPTVTLICALGVVGILLYCKKRKEVIA